MIKQYFLLLLFSFNIFSAQREMSLAELMLQRRLGCISHEEYVGHIKDCTIAELVDQDLTDQDKNGHLDESFTGRINLVRDRICSWPSSLPHVLRKLKYYENNQFIRKRLCLSFLCNDTSEADDILRAMFHHGIDVNDFIIARDFTPLLVATARGNIRRVALFLELQADPTKSLQYINRHLMVDDGDFANQNNRAIYELLKKAYDSRRAEVSWLESDWYCVLL